LAVDPEISLQVQTPQLDVGAIYARALQIKQAQQQMGVDNALRAILAQPGAVDDKTGLATNNTLAAISKVGPQGVELAAKLADQASLAQQRAVTTKRDMAVATVDEMKAASETLQSRLDTYDAEMASGNTDPKIAEDGLRSSLKDYVYSQPWSRERQDGYWARVGAMPVTGLRALSQKLAMTTEERQRQAAEMGETAKAEKLLTEERTPATMNGKPVTVDKTGAVYDPNTNEKIPVTGPIIKQEPGFNPQAADARAENVKPTLENDPVTGQQYWAFPPTKDKGPHYQTLDGAPYQPQGAARIQSGQVRGGIAGAIQAAQSENQAKGLGPLTSDQIEQISADYTRKTRSAAAFGVGKQGDQVRFLNVAMDHLGTLKEAAAALKNGDVPKFNAVAKIIAQETGSPVPTNFDAIRQIVSQEVHKGVAGVGGSAEERDNLAKNVDRAASPEQLSGAIESVDKLLAGQADGLRRQYETSTGLDNFGDMLSPNARSLLSNHPDDAKQTARSGGGGLRKPSATEISQFESLPPSRKEEARKWARDHGVDLSGAR